MLSSAVPAPEPMLNNWSVYDTHEGFTWESDLPPGADLLTWQDSVLLAGERHGVLRIMAAPDWDYRRDRDGAPQSWLQRHGDPDPREPLVAEGLLFASVRNVTATLLAFATPHGLVEDWFTDVADLATAAGIPPPRHTGYEPVMLAVVGWDDGSTTVSLATATDIWFPRTGGGHFDNSLLAARNAPRLNAFLTDLRNACAAAGGNWRWLAPENYEMKAGLIVL